MKYWLSGLVAKVVLFLVTFLESALRLSKQTMSLFGLIQRQERETMILNFDGENTVLFAFFTLFLNNCLKISTLLKPNPCFSPLPFTVLLLIRPTYLLASMRLTWASAAGTFDKASCGFAATR